MRRKSNRAGMPYKRSSRISRHFWSPNLAPIRGQEEFFNSHPCIYYGTEQAFDSAGQPSSNDRVLRENMFGGRFGGKCSRGVHFFDEDAPLFKAVSKLCELRRDWIALRRGRQYVHEISGDGVHFGPPVKFGDRLHTLVSWSRVVA